MLAWRIWAHRADDADVLNGYIEGDSLYLSAPVAGTVGQVYVARGQRVAAGAPLFAMDPATIAAQEEQARGRMAQSREQAGAAAAAARQSQAEVAAARAAEAGALKDLRRLAGLQRSNPLAVSGHEVDQARTAADQASARRRSAEAAAHAAEVQIGAAQGAAEQAAGALQESGVRLGQLAQRAPAAGRVEDVYYQAGEWAAANQPIVSLLPDGQVKLRFFAPEASAQAYQPGRLVRFGCDGCRAGLQARISYLAPKPEFTPPVIYSRKSRSKLVFLVEAVPADPSGLAPGQPVDVVPLVRGSRQP